MRHIAIIGSGPAGYYTAEALVKLFGDDVHIDILDRLPTPFGLIRYGVAPDHQSIKAVSRRYEKTALNDNVRFVGNIEVGKHVSIAELQGLYDAIVIATGAPNDRGLNIGGSDLDGVIGSAALVGWYNGHPDHQNLSISEKTRNIVVIGNGNVALDVARIFSKNRDEFAGSDITAQALDVLDKLGIDTITILGRRSPHHIAMTPKELGELLHLEQASPVVEIAQLPDIAADDDLEPGQRKSVTLLREFAALEDSDRQGKKRRINFRFFTRPVECIGSGHIEKLVVERTELDDNGRATGTGEAETIPCDLLISCIGYRTPPLGDIPYDEGLGRFISNDGRIGDGLYCVGWARRGPAALLARTSPMAIILLH